MIITDELRKLADLRTEGHLTDQEFAAAKTGLLAQSQSEDIAAKPLPAMTKAAPRIVEQTYCSSRWSAGNFFFPDSLTLGNDGIVFRKGRLLGSTEENINYRAIASVRLGNGVLFSRMCIETSGGSQPIYINGLWRAEAKAIQETIRTFQRG